MCMAAGLEPAHHVHVNGWLLVGGEKLGKTMAAEGGVKLTDIEPIALTKEFGVDPLRYYLLRETALGNDGEFSLESIVARYNTDLANNLGNLVARVTTSRGRVGTPRSRPRVGRLRAAACVGVDMVIDRRHERVPRNAGAMEDGTRRAGRRRHG